MKDKMKRIFVLVLIILLFTEVVSAASLYGVVKDESGAGLPGANVYVTESGETKFGAVTDADGKYAIRNLPAGIYTIEPKFIGYATNSRTIKFNQNDDKEADFVMKQTAVQLPEQKVEATRLPSSGGSAGGGGGSSGQQGGIAGPLRPVYTYTPPPTIPFKESVEKSINGKVALGRRELNAVQRSCKDASECGEGMLCFGGKCKSKDAGDSCQESDPDVVLNGVNKHNDPYTRDALIDINNKKILDKCACEYSGQYREDCRSLGREFTHVAEYSCSEEKPVEYVKCENGCSLGKCISFDFDKGGLNVLERKVFDDYSKLTGYLGKIGRVQFLTDDGLREQVYGIVDNLFEDAYNAAYLHTSDYNLMMMDKVAYIQRSLYQAEHQNALIELNTKCRDCTEQGLLDYRIELGVDDKEKKHNEVVGKQAEYYQNLLDRDSVTDPVFVNQVRTALFGLLISNPQILGNVGKARKLVLDARDAFAERNKASVLENYRKRNIAFNAEEYNALQKGYEEMAIIYLRFDTLPLVGNAVQQVAEDAQAKRAALTTTEDIFEEVNLEELREKAGGDEDLFGFYFNLETASRIYNTASIYGEGKKLAVSTGTNKGDYECQQTLDYEIDKAKAKIGAMLALSSFGVGSLGSDISQVKIDADKIKAYSLADAFYVIKDGGVSIRDAAALIGADLSHQNGYDDLPDYSPLYSMKAKIKNLEIRDFQKLKTVSDKGIAWYYVKDYQDKEAIFIGCVASGSSWNWPGDTGAVMISKEDAITYFETLPLIAYDIGLEKDVYSANNLQLQKVMDSRTLQLARTFRQNAGTYPYNIAAQKQAVNLYSGLIAKGYKYQQGEDNGNRDVDEELEDMLGGTWHDLNLADATTGIALVEGTLKEMTNVLGLAARAKLAAKLEPYLANARTPVKRVLAAAFGVSREAQAAKGVAFSSSFAEFETRVASSLGKTKPGKIAYFGKEGFKFVTEEGAEEIFGAAAQSGVQAVAPNAPFIGDVVGMVAEIIGGDLKINPRIDAKLNKDLGKDFKLNRKRIKTDYEGPIFLDTLYDAGPLKTKTDQIALAYFWKNYVDGKYIGGFAQESIGGVELIFNAELTENGVKLTHPDYQPITISTLTEFRDRGLKFIDDPKLDAELEYYLYYIDEMYRPKHYSTIFSSKAYLNLKSKIGDDFSLRVIKALVNENPDYLYVPNRYYSVLPFDERDIDIFIQKYVIGKKDPSSILLTIREQGVISDYETISHPSYKTTLHPRTGQPVLVKGDLFSQRMQYGTRYEYIARFQKVWNSLYDEYKAEVERSGKKPEVNFAELDKVRNELVIEDPSILIEKQKTHLVNKYRSFEGFERKVAAQNLLLYGVMDLDSELYSTLFSTFDTSRYAPPSLDKDMVTSFFNALIDKKELGDGFRIAEDKMLLEEVGIAETDFPETSLVILKERALERGKYINSPDVKMGILFDEAIKIINDPEASSYDGKNAYQFLLIMNKIRKGIDEESGIQVKYITDTFSLATLVRDNAGLDAGLNEYGLKFVYDMVGGENRLVSSDFTPLSQKFKERLQFLDPGFQNVFNHPLIQSNSVIRDIKYSEALSAYRLMKRNPSFTAEAAIRYIFKERDDFSKQEILGPRRNVIIFANREGMFDIAKMNEMAVYSYNTPASQVLGGPSSSIKGINLGFKGREAKADILKAISSSKRDTTLWFNGHGGKDAMWLDKGLPQELLTLGADAKKINAISYEELGNALIEIAKRNDMDLSHVIIMADQCFSYDFGQNLYNYLFSKGVRKLPVFIGASNLNSYGFGNVFNDAIRSVGDVGAEQKFSSLTGRDILNSERNIERRLSDFVIFVPDENSADLSVPTAGECSVVTCLPGGVEIGMVDDGGEQVA